MFPIVPFTKRGRLGYHLAATCYQCMLIIMILFVVSAHVYVFYYESEVIFEDIAATAVQCRRFIETCVSLLAILTSFLKRRDHLNLLNGIEELDSGIKDHLQV